MMMYQTIPASDALDAFIKNTAEYLNHKGVFSFALHSIIR